MNPIELKIRGEFIELFQLLKFAHLTETGGQAKDVIRAGMVTLNGQPVSELRKKIRPGDVVVFGEQTITVSLKESE